MTQLRTLHQSPTVLVPEQVLLPEGPQSGHAVLIPAAGFSLPAPSPR